MESIITPTQYAAGFLAFAFIVIGLLVWAAHKAPEPPKQPEFFTDSEVDEAYADTVADGLYDPKL